MTEQISNCKTQDLRRVFEPLQSWVGKLNDIPNTAYKICSNKLELPGSYCVSISKMWSVYGVSVSGVSSDSAGRWGEGGRRDFSSTLSFNDFLEVLFDCRPEALREGSLSPQPWPRARVTINVSVSLLWEIISKVSPFLLEEMVFGSSNRMSCWLACTLNRSTTPPGSILPLYPLSPPLLPSAPFSQRKIA